MAREKKAVWLDNNGEPVWKRQYEQQKRYNAENTVQCSYRFNKKSDADIIEALNKAPSKQKFIRTAIRFYLAHREEEDD